MQLEVKFKKTHKDAQIPTRKHGNRELNSYELDMLIKENERFEQERPEQYAAGYRIGLSYGYDKNGKITNLIAGTGDTGYDIFSIEDKEIPVNGSAIVDTGIELAYISPGYWFKIEARSGLGFRYGVAPHPGIVDNCVPAGTKIATPNGEKNIEDIFKSADINDKYVLSYNEEKNSIENDEICDIWIVENVDLLKIQTENSSIEIPREKEIMTKRGWIKAQDLIIEDEILSIL